MSNDLRVNLGVLLGRLSLQASISGSRLDHLQVSGHPLPIVELLALLRRVLLLFNDLNGGVVRLIHDVDVTVLAL